MNNRKILNGFYAMLGSFQQSGEIMRTVDKLDKIGPDKVAELLVQSGLSPEQAREILSFTSITGTNEEVLTALEGYRGRNEVFDLGLDELNASARRGGVAMEKSKRRRSYARAYYRLSVLCLAAMVTARLILLMIDVIQLQIQTAGAFSIPRERGNLGIHRLGAENLDRSRKGEKNHVDLQV